MAEHIAIRVELFEELAETPTDTCAGVIRNRADWDQFQTTDLARLSEVGQRICDAAEERAIESGEDTDEG